MKKILLPWIEKNKDKIDLRSLSRNIMAIDYLEEHP